MITTPNTDAKIVDSTPVPTRNPAGDVGFPAAEPEDPRDDRDDVVATLLGRVRALLERTRSAIRT